MLDYARQNAPLGHYLLDDARSFHLPEQFDAAFSTSASLNHIMTLADLTLVFRNLYQALRPGGLFVFDLNHPDQMQKWWRNHIAEGEITPRYAWRLTPEYYPETSEGAFHVEIFQAQLPASGLARLTYPLRQSLYRLLSLRRLTRFRLRPAVPIRKKSNPPGRDRTSPTASKATPLPRRPNRPRIRRLHRHHPANHRRQPHPRCKPLCTFSSCRKP